MPPTLLTNPAANLTILLILVGLVGAVVPVIPGPPLIWLGMFAWAVGENFQRVDWLTLTALGILALAATFSEYWLAPLAQKRAGLSWKHIGAAMAGGIAGGIVLSEIPVLGTLFGAAIGSVAAVSALTYWRSRNLRASARAGKAYLVGCFLSSVVEIILSLAMLALFAWQAFF